MESPPQRRRIATVHRCVALPLTVFVILVYGAGIAIYMRSPAAIEQQASFYEPSLGTDRQPPYFQFIFADLSIEQLFFVIRGYFIRNQLLTYDWNEFRYNTTVVGGRDGGIVPIRHSVANRGIFEWEASATTEFSAVSLSEVPFDVLVVSVSFDRHVRALVGLQLFVNYVSSETVYWLRGPQMAVETAICFALVVLASDFPCRIAFFQVCSFLLCCVAVLSLDPIILSRWAASDGDLLATQQAVGRVLTQCFRAYVLAHVDYFTSDGPLFRGSICFWVLFFAVVCGRTDYRASLAAIEAVQRTHAIELQWSYAEMFGVIGDIAFVGCALCFIAKLCAIDGADRCHKALWAVVLAGAAAHATAVAAMSIARDFVPFAGGMAAAVMYGAVAVVLVFACRPAGRACDPCELSGGASTDL